MSTGSDRVWSRVLACRPGWAQTNSCVSRSHRLPGANRRPIPSGQLQHIGGCWIERTASERSMAAVPFQRGMCMPVSNIDFYLPSTASLATQSGLEHCWMSDHHDLEYHFRRQSKRPSLATEKIRREQTRSARIIVMTRWSSLRSDSFQMRYRLFQGTWKLASVAQKTSWTTSQRLDSRYKPPVLTSFSQN